jgi:regulator of replication initiation timing
MKLIEKAKKKAADKKAIHERVVKENAQLRMNHFDMRAEIVKLKEKIEDYQGLEKKYSSLIDESIRLEEENVQLKAALSELFD